MPKETAKEFEDKKFLDYAEIDDAIGDIISLFTGHGAYDDMLQFRTDKEVLQPKLDNIYNADWKLTSKTKKTKILKSGVIRTEVDIFTRKMNIPVFDIEPVNRSKSAFEEKTKASITKALMEWFIRVTGYEDVTRESREDQAAYGDRYLRPGIREIDEKRSFPMVEDLRGESVMLDSNSTYVTSESVAKQAQYDGHTQMYSEQAIIARYGKWILDYAASGHKIDDRRFPAKRKVVNTTFWEVLELQNKSDKTEFELVGSNAFPVLRRVENEEYDNAEDFQKNVEKEYQRKFGKKLPDEVTQKTEWGDKYIYEDSFGNPILTLTNHFMYYDPDSSRNLGLTQRLSSPQVMDEMLQNLTKDNMLKKLQLQIPTMAGGNQAKMKRNLDEYQLESETNRLAIWFLPGSLNQKNLPTPGIIKYEGFTAEEGRVAIQDNLDFVKNVTGVDPQQQEVQKNTAVAQTEIIEEKSTESIESIAENNLSNSKSELKVFLSHIIAHDGYGLQDVQINFTLYSEDTPDGNDSATISIPEAAKRVKGHEFDIIIDRSSLIKRARASEIKTNVEFLGLLDAQADPGGFIALRSHIAKLQGVNLPELTEDQARQIKPQGGKSQFQTNETQ